MIIFSKVTKIEKSNFWSKFEAFKKFNVNCGRFYIIYKIIIDQRFHRSMFVSCVKTIQVEK